MVRPIEPSVMHTLEVTDPAPYLLKQSRQRCCRRHTLHTDPGPCAARAFRNSLMHSSEVKPASRGRCRRAYSAWRCATSTPRCAWKRLVTAASLASCSSLSRSAACAAQEQDVRLA